MSTPFGPPSWLANHEARYADDFEEEDSFLILPIRRDPADIEADVANAAGEVLANVAAEVVTNSPSNPSIGLNSTAPVVEPEASDLAVRQDSSQLMASPKGSLEKPHPVPMNIPLSQIPTSGELGMDSEQLSVISAVSTISSSDGSWEETNMLLSQLDLQSCKEKMAQMNASAKKNLEDYKAVVSKLQESLTTIHEDYKKKNEECGETIRALRLENQTLKADLDKKFSDLNEQTLEKSRLHTEKDALTRENSGREVEINHLKAKVEEFTIRILQTERQNMDLLGQIQNLEQLLAQQNKGEPQMSSLLEERNELNEAWQASKVAIEQLKGIRAEHEEKIKMLTRMLEESNQKIFRWEEFVRKKDEDILKLKSALDEAGAKLHEFQAIIAAKELESFDFQTKIAALMSESEKTEIYKQQMEEYKSNFEDERRDRVKTRERLELANRELAQVKTELEEKTTELENLHRTHLQFANEHVNRDEDASAASSRPSQEENSDGATEPVQPPLQSSFPEVSLGPQTPDPCPICKRRFNSFSSLERHAANCGIEANATNTNPFVFP